MVEVVQGHEAITAVKDARPNIFTTYHVQNNLLNGMVYYTSEDGTGAIAYNKGRWRIGTPSALIGY